MQRRRLPAPAEEKPVLSLFLSEIKNESESFKNAVRFTSSERCKSNDEYQRYSRESFNAMYRQRKKQEQDPRRFVPRLSRPQTATPKKRHRLTRDEIDAMEFDMRVTNNDRWPMRNITNMSQRVLSPEKLQDYPDTRRRRDKACVLGSPVRLGDLWS